MMNLFYLIDQTEMTQSKYMFVASIGIRETDVHFVILIVKLHIYSLATRYLYIYTIWRHVFPCVLKSIYLSPDIVWQGKKDIENLEMPSEYIYEGIARIQEQDSSVIVQYD